MSGAVWLYHRGITDEGCMHSILKVIECIIEAIEAAYNTPSANRDCSRRLPFLTIVVKFNAIIVCTKFR
jgi:hypothetical protein